MDRASLRSLLEDHRAGGLTTEEALAALRDFPEADLGYARIDTHRPLRQGFPEVILAQGKSVAQVTGIASRMLEHGTNVLVTRTAPEQVDALRAAFPHVAVETHEPASIVLLRQVPVPVQGRGVVAVVAAGTADLPVAIEAVVTLEAMGNEVDTIYDVGVAGLHRLFAQRHRLLSAEVIVIAAGMDAALPSVVAGLVDRPIVAVPTSTGYGASFGGLAALLALLNSCAAGVTVVNIDNGFGAGFAAARINRRRDGDGAPPAGAGQEVDG